MTNNSLWNRVFGEKEGDDKVTAAARDAYRIQQNRSGLKTVGTGLAGAIVAGVVLGMCGGQSPRTEAGVRIVKEVVPCKGENNGFNRYSSGKGLASQRRGSGPSDGNVVGTLETRVDKFECTPEVVIPMLQEQNADLADYLSVNPDAATEAIACRDGRDISYEHRKGDTSTLMFNGGTDGRLGCRSVRDFRDQGAMNYGACSVVDPRLEERVEEEREPTPQVPAQEPTLVAETANQNRKVSAMVGASETPMYIDARRVDRQYVGSASTVTVTVDLPLPGRQDGFQVTGEVGVGHVAELDRNLGLNATAITGGVEGTYVSAPARVADKVTVRGIGGIGYGNMPIPGLARTGNGSWTGHSHGAGCGCEGGSGSGSGDGSTDVSRLVARADHLYATGGTDFSLGKEVHLVTSGNVGFMPGLGPVYGVDARIAFELGKKKR